MGFASGSGQGRQAAVLTLLALIASQLAVMSMANRAIAQLWKNDISQHHHPNALRPPKDFKVGDTYWDELWRFNFTEWALKTGPFYVNDTLVFYYRTTYVDPEEPQDVYLLPNLRSFLKCDFSKGKQLGGVDDGFFGLPFKLTKSRPYYFSSSQSNGTFCKKYGFKMFVPAPLPRTS